MREPKRWKVELLNLDGTKQVIYPKWLGTRLVSWNLQRQWEYTDIDIHEGKLTAKEVTIGRTSRCKDR